MINERQVVKLKNLDVKDIDIRKLNNAGENFLTESEVIEHMIKLRLEYLENSELEKALDILEQDFNILNQSKPYQNRNSLYKRLYVDIEEK